jgi:hypothetical protein
VGEPPGGGFDDPPPSGGDGDGGDGVPPDTADPTPSGGIEPGARPAEDGGPPPSGNPPSGQEPVPDSSGGGGGGNNPEGESPEPPDVPAPGTTDPDDADNNPPPAPQANGSGFAREPEYASYRGWMNTNFRGTNGTIDRRHLSPSASDKGYFLIPCFRSWEESSGAVVRRVGRNDSITITDGLAEAPTRYTAVVRWGDNQGNWAALDDFITGPRIEAPPEGAATERLDWRGWARILMVPCGELPDEMPEEMEWARSSVTRSDVVTAFLDELFVWRHATHPLCVVVNAEGVPAEGKEISLAPQVAAQTLEGIAGYDKDCGLLSLDGELIVWRGTRSEGTNVLTLENCERGMFGTKARMHPPGSYGRLVYDVPVSYLDGNLTRDSASLALVHVRGWPTEGLLRAVRDEGEELMHYTRIVGNDVVMPEALDADESVRGRGLFRGRFGSDVTDHESQEVVIWQPFRYWDRYTGRRTVDKQSFSGVHEHPEASYLELGRRERSVVWERVAWERNDSGRSQDDGDDRRRRDRGGTTSSFLDLLVLARFNPNIPWDSDQVIDLRHEDTALGLQGRGDPSKSLYLFGDPEAANKIGLECDTAEFRIFYVYRPFAWTPQDLPASGGGADEDLVFSNYWKQTPWLKEFTVEYTNRTTRRYRSPVAK